MRFPLQFLLVAAGLGHAAMAQQLSTGGFTASWTIVGAQSNQMYFQVSGNTAGTTGPWVGISMDPNGQSHAASDMYVGYQSSAGVGVLDTYSAQQAQPSYDTQQDALNPVVVVDSTGNLNFSFVRNFDTGDTANDQVITSATTTIGWAFGAGATLTGANSQYNYHGKTNRGNSNFNLVTTATTPAPTAVGTTLAPTLAPTIAPTNTPAPTFGPTPAISVPSGSFSYVSTNKDFTAIWNVGTTNITMTMYAICSGYIGVSFGNVNSISHSSSDTIVGWVTSSGVVNILDAYSNSLTQPVFDTTTQDVVATGGQVTSQGMFITFTRLLQNADTTQDYQFVNNGNGTNFGWAYSLTAPSGTGSFAAYAQHTKIARDNAKLNMFTGQAIASTTTTSGSLIATSDGSAKIQWVPTVDAATGAPAFQFVLSTTTSASWIGVGFATTRTHTATDFYVAYKGSAGVTVIDLFSNDQTNTQLYDLSQDAKMITGSVSSNGTLTAVFTRLADTKDTAGDVVIPNGPIVMSVALGAGGAVAPPATVTGSNVTYSAHTPASTAARSAFSLNLFIGSVSTASPSVSPTQNSSSSPASTSASASNANVPLIAAVCVVGGVAVGGALVFIVFKRRGAKEPVATPLLPTNTNQ